MRRTAYTATPTVARALLAVACTCSMATAAVGTAAADPAREQTPANVVAALVAEIAQADQLIANLRGDMSAKRQSVNRAVVDVQSARNAATAAAGAVKVSETEVSRAAQRITAAQAASDEAVRAAYRDGNTAGALVNTLGGNDPDTALDQASTLGILAEKQQAALKTLNAAKTKAVTSRTAARAAKVQADAATAAAEARKVSAENDITNTVLTLNSTEAKQTQLTAQRELAQKALDQAKAAKDRDQQQQIYAKYVVDEQQTQPVTPAAQAAPGAPAAPEQAPAAATTPDGSTAAEPLAESLTAARSFAENIVSQAGSFLGIGAPAGPATPTAAPAAAPAASAQVQSAVGMTGAQAIEAVIARGMSVIGVQYAWGGGTAYGATRGVRDGGTADRYGDYNRIGFDCSGFTAFAYAAVGIALPKYSGYQYTTGRQVPISQVKRGDLVFRGPGGTQHVAIYLGNNQMLESPQSGGAVRIAPFDASTFIPNAVRVINS